MSTGNMQNLYSMELTDKDLDAVAGGIDYLITILRT